ncbi:MAG: response regulator [Roseiflexaceae bacterium]
MHSRTPPHWRVMANTASSTIPALDTTVRPDPHVQSEVADQPSAAILVAEDNEVNQQVVRYVVQALGYNVDVVANGREAVAALANRAYAAILMDIQMPEMDGYMATVEIRRIEGTARHTPIIALTAHVLHGEREKCLAAGMDDYLSKPIVPQALAAALKRWVGRDIQEPANLIPSEPSVDAPLDSTVLANLRKLKSASGETILPQLLATFSAATPPRLAALRAAIAAEDVHAVSHGAHTLKGSSATMGARRMAQLCADLEMLGQTSDLSHATSILADIEAEFARVRTALEQEIMKV